MRESKKESSVWAITCYFNPVGYTTRRTNYSVFRRHLSVPLLAVELSFDDYFHLDAADADRLIQVKDGDILWQKERLLNLALDKLPDHCTCVIWLDCELVFERKDLAVAVEAELERWPLIQPFSRVYDLKPTVEATAPLEGNVELERASMAWLIREGALDVKQSKTDMSGHHSPGHAWAVRRSLIEGIGFYDGMILGSADFAMAMAALGQAEGVADSYMMNKQQRAHYLDWAYRCHQLVDSKIGVLEGGIRHLWHGSLENRGYSTRYAALQPYQFDPYQDIGLGDSGCWVWNSDKPEMHQFFRNYFKSRKEDGEAGY